MKKPQHKYVFGVWLYIHEFLEMSLSEMSHWECKFSFSTVGKTIFQIEKDSIYSKSLRIKQVQFLIATRISYQFDFIFSKPVFHSYVFAKPCTRSS